MEELAAGWAALQRCGCHDGSYLAQRLRQGGGGRDSVPAHRLARKADSWIQRCRGETTRRVEAVNEKGRACSSSWRVLPGC